MQYRAVIFDMDGTLLNSLEDLADSVEEMLSFYGYPGHTLEEYRYFVGNGPRKLIQRSLPKDMAENETFVDEALVRYKGIYEKNMMNKSKPYEGILEMLGKLQQKGIPLAVCTNKQEPAARLIAAKLFPAGIFREIVGDVPGQARKPDPSRALQITERMGVLPEEVAYLGDSPVDMEMASRAGFLGIGVSWGFRPESELVESGADLLLKHPMELLERLDFAEKEDTANEEAENIQEEQPTKPKIFFVDYENVNVGGMNGLQCLTEQDAVHIFYSEHANTMTFGLHRRLNLCKAEIQYHHVETGHKNALDLQLSSCLGFVIGINQAAEYFIVSKDTAFSSVAQYWKKRKVPVQVVPHLAGQLATKGTNAKEQTDDLATAVKKVISDPEDAAFGIQCIQTYKAKTEVHNALVQKYKDNQKVKEIYQAIKSLIGK